jgi:hypothetical protein
MAVAFIDWNKYIRPKPAAMMGTAHAAREREVRQVVVLCSDMDFLA